MATKNAEGITIARPNIQTTTIRIVGDTPLIMHAWSEKAKRMMLEAQQGKSKGKKKPRKSPIDDFIQSIYWIRGKPGYVDDATDDEIDYAYSRALLNGAQFGFPATAIKQAATVSPYRLGIVKNQTSLRASFFIESKHNGLIEIHSDPPEMREDMVRVGMGTADIRYRAQFNNWYADLTIQYNASSDISLETIINAINLGGFSCGIGEWRPEKDGTFGRFHVEPTA